MDLDTELLIEEVKKRTAIWDNNAEDYTNQKARSAHWVQISKALYPQYETLSSRDKNLLAKELQAKWKNTRDCYVRYWRMKTKVSKTTTYLNRRLKPYCYAKLLEFLVPTIGTCRRYRRKFIPLDSKAGENISGNSTDEVEDHDEMAAAEQVGGTKTSPDVRSQTEINNPKANLYQPEQNANCVEKNLEVNHFQPEEDMNSSSQTQNHFQQEQQTTSASLVQNTDHQRFKNDQTDGDDDMDFFRSLLPVLKPLPLYQKLQFRMEVMKTATEFSMRGTQPPLPVQPLRVPPAQQTYSNSVQHRQKPHSFPPQQAWSGRYPQPRNSEPSQLRNPPNPVRIKRKRSPRSEKPPTKKRVRQTQPLPQNEPLLLIEPLPQIKEETALDGSHHQPPSPAEDSLSSVKSVTFSSEDDDNDEDLPVLNMDDFGMT